MQQRVLVNQYPLFTAAHEAKVKLQTLNPDNNYQIRKHKNGFGLFHRFSINEIIANEAPNASKRFRKARRHG